MLVGHTEGVTFLDAAGDGRHVLSNCKDQTAKLWDLRRMLSERQVRRAGGGGGEGGGGRPAAEARRGAPRALLGWRLSAFSRALIPPLPTGAHAAAGADAGLCVGLPLGALPGCALRLRVHLPAARSSLLAPRSSTAPLRSPLTSRSLPSPNLCDPLSPPHLDP